MEDDEIMKKRPGLSMPRLLKEKPMDSFPICAD